MRLSCTSTMVPGKSLTEKARNLSRWGYEGIAVFVALGGKWDFLYFSIIVIHSITYFYK